MDEIISSKAVKVTLMGLGNFKVNGSELIYLPEDTDFSNTLKLTWLPVGNHQKITMKYFGHLVNKAILGPDDDYKEYVNVNSLRVFNGFV